MPKGWEASNDAGFVGFTRVHDLNFRSNICDAFESGRPGVKHERGQDADCAGVGVGAMEDLRTRHRAPSRRRRCAYLELRRSVSCDGLLAVDLARVLARYRALPASQSRLAVSHGLLTRTCPLDTPGCVERPGLVHLSRSGHAPDRSCAGSLCQRTAGDRSGSDGVRTQCHHHRAGSEPVRLGTVSLGQGGSEDAHVAGLARGQSCLDPYQRPHCISMPRSTLCYRYCRCPFSRSPR